MQTAFDTPERGAALLDVIFTCGFIAVVAVIAIPSFTVATERDAPLLAARFLAGKISALRVEAVRRNRVVAIRFDPADLGAFAAFVDGDGDGVRQNDVDNGIDAALDSSASISQYFATAHVRVGTDVPAPDANGIIAAGSDPIRIGNSNFLSLHPVGTSTSGTIYFAGEGGTQVCLRVFGATGRVRVLWLDRAAGVWRQE